MTPLIRGSNPRLPEPLAGRCPPDTRALAQPSAPRAAGPVADGPRTLPNRDVQIYGITGRLPLLTPFSRPSSRAPAHQRRNASRLLRICTGDAGSCRTAPIRTGIRDRTPDAGGCAVRLDFLRIPADTLTALPYHPSQTAGPGGSSRRWAGSSHEVRLEPHSRGAGMTCP